MMSRVGMHCVNPKIIWLINQFRITKVTCLPSASKCEWAELKYFVQHYNEVRNRSFQHECCLDLRTTLPAPEVLCRDEAQSTIVIERKTLVWPSNYVQAHKAWHIVVDEILRLLGPCIRSKAFALTLPEPESFSDKALTDLAKEISREAAEQIPRLHEGESVNLKSLVGTVFWREYACDRDDDEPKTGLIFRNTESPRADLSDPIQTPTEFDQVLSTFFEACKKKFQAHSNSRKILVLNLVSMSLYDQLDSNWWTVYLSKNAALEAVDEIWVSFNFGEAESDWTFTNIYAANVARMLASGSS
jgi:hypothetical protein